MWTKSKRKVVFLRRTSLRPSVFINISQMIPWILTYYLFADTIATEWQEWGEWSQCSVSCGKGAEIRARACNKPDVGGSQSCPGDSTEARDCNLTGCTGGVQYIYSFISTITKIPIIRKRGECHWPMHR